MIWEYALTISPGLKPFLFLCFFYQIKARPLELWLSHLPLSDTQSCLQIYILRDHFKWTLTWRK